MKTDILQEKDKLYVLKFNTGSSKYTVGVYQLPKLKEISLTDANKDEYTNIIIEANILALYHGDFNKKEYVPEHIYRIVKKMALKKMVANETRTDNS